MKRVTLLCGMLLALTAAVVSAAPGTNLRWNACLGDAGAFNRNFACNTNSGVNAVVGSIELGAPIASASGNEIVIDIASASPALPAWWQMRNAGTCRPTALGINFTNSLTASCLDWSDGQGAGGIGAYNIGVAGPNTARLVAACAVPPTALVNLGAGVEYFITNVVVSNAKTVGDGLCDGCNVGVCLVYNSNKVTTPVPANDRIISGPTNGTDSNFCTWQGGGVPVTPRGSGCGAATPTKNATWGAVKSLYR